MIVRTRFLAILLLAGLPAAAGDRTRLLRTGPDSYRLEARGRLSEIAAGIGGAGRFAVEVDPSIAGRRLELQLSARPPERLLRAVARRAGVLVAVRYRLAPLEPGAAWRPGPRCFATERVSIQVPSLTPVQEAAARLPLPVETAQSLRGRVRIAAEEEPLHRVLDHLSAQVRARWEPMVRLEAPSGVDREAAAESAARAFYEGLVELPPAEQREEAEADVARIAELPAAERERAARSLAERLRGMGPLLDSVPGEHRGPVRQLTAGIHSAYREALAGNKDLDPGLVLPIRAALDELAGRIERSR